MRETASTVLAWRDQGHRVALAVVTRTWGSSPRDVGAMMAVSDEGHMTGSVSAGCVEGQVLLAALCAIKRQQPCLATFGTTDDKAWEVGAPCGGDIEVLVLPYQDELHEPLMRALATGAPCTLVACLDGIERADDLLEREDAEVLLAPGGTRSTALYEEGPAVVRGKFVPFRDAQAVAAGDAAVADAVPLANNAYKVEIARTLVKRTLLAMAQVA